MPRIRSRLGSPESSIPGGGIPSRDVRADLAMNPEATVYGDDYVAQPQSPGVCCYDTEANALVCEDGSTQGVEGVSQISDADGNPLFIVQTQSGEQITVGACAGTPSGGGDDGGGEVGPDCCYDASTGQLVCDGQASSGAVQVINQIADVDGNLLVVVAFGDQQMTVPVCNAPPPPPPPGGGGGQCCYDKAMSMLVCDPGDPRDGQSVTVTNSFVQPDGTAIVVVRLPDGSVTDATVCASPPGMCCYDVATGTLRCPKNPGLNGQQVSLVAMAQQPDGTILAIVQIQGQESVTTYPICDDKVSNCCYDGDAKKIVCDDPSLAGMDAAVVASWTDNDGVVWVWAAWAGGGARMPMCPGKTCPPILCCVNVETMRYVCPGRLDLNGQAAQLADIVTEDGFNWGVLADGSRVPLCGRDCPPPEICPQCPTCPADLWMSPDGECVPPPQCPQCPGDEPPCPPYPGPMSAGYVVSNPARQSSAPRHGLQRVRGTPVGRKSNPCCDECAKNKPCTGCGGSKKNPMTEQISMNYGEIRHRYNRRRVSRRWRVPL